MFILLEFALVKVKTPLFIKSFVILVIKFKITQVRSVGLISDAVR